MASDGAADAAAGLTGALRPSDNPQDLYLGDLNGLLGPEPAVADEQPVQVPPALRALPGGGAIVAGVLALDASNSHKQLRLDHAATLVQRTQHMSAEQVQQFKRRREEQLQRHKSEHLLQFESPIHEHQLSGLASSSASIPGGGALLGRFADADDRLEGAAGRLEGAAERFEDAWARLQVRDRRLPRLARADVERGVHGGHRVLA